MTSPRISVSVMASPGPGAAFSCHCSQRALLVMDPSSSAKQVVGRRNTSVAIFDGSTSWYSPKFFQNSPVSTVSGSMITKYLSFDSPSKTLALFGKAARMLKPWQKAPVALPNVMSLMA